MTDSRYVRVAVFRPIRSSFEYSLPPGLREEVTSGSICSVPFGEGTERALVLELASEPEYEGERKEVEGLISPAPLQGTLVELARWLSYTTYTPLGQVFNRMVPRDLSVRPRPRRMIALKARFDRVRNFLEEEARRSPRQAELLNYLLAAEGPLEKKELLEGTGSSRSPLNSLVAKGLVEEFSVTEVDSEEESSEIDLPLSGLDPGVIDRLDRISDGFQVYATGGGAEKRLAIYLETVRRFAEEGIPLVLAPDVFRAEELAAIIRRELDLVSLSYHSDLTEGELSSRWNLARTGAADVFVGALNAVYLPVSSLSGILVEGDGDRNFELTEQDPRGQLAETAYKRAELEGVPLVVGGVRPSLGSYFALEEGKYRKLGKPLAAGAKRGVDLSLVNTSGGPEGATLKGDLRKAIKRNYTEGDLALVIGEKVGASSAAVCEKCGQVLRCPDCSVPLTYTTGGNYGVCPYCGARSNLLVCPACGSDRINFIGTGLEAAETEINSFLPEAEVRRFDSRAGSWEDFSAIARGALAGEIDVLLGTSLIASYYFRGRVSLVGLLDLDIILNRPSYRSTEFLLNRVLTGMDLVEEDGEVVLQTFRPRGEPFNFIGSRAWKGVYESELESRRLLDYPPHKRLFRIRAEGGAREKVRDKVESLKEKLREAEGNFRLLGPVETNRGDGETPYELELVVKVDHGERFLEVFHRIAEDQDYDDMRLNPFA